MALTTVTAVKLHLGLTGSSEDAFLTQLLGAVETAFANLIDRQLELQSYTEFCCGTGNAVLRLREYPVTAVTSVWLDRGGLWGQAPDAFAADTLLVAGEDYALVKDGRGGVAEVGRLLRVGGVWPGRWVSVHGLLTAQMKPGAGNVKCVYTAGYSTIPADVQLAIWQVCAQLRQARRDGLILQSESFEEYMYTLGTLTQQAFQVGGPAQVVARYQRLTSRHEVLG